MSNRIRNTAITLFLISFSATATAYVGPGAGISVLGSLLGILATIVLAIGAILMWPIRRMLKRKKARAAESSAAASAEAVQTETAQPEAVPPEATQD